MEGRTRVDWWRTLGARVRRRLRRGALITLGLASVGAGVWLQFSTRSAIPLGEASTPQLLGILGLLVLPAISLMLVAADRRS